MPQASQRQATPQADLRLVAPPAAESNWREIETKNSQKIANAQKPIVLISETAAKTWGTMAKYLTETFPQTPFVFETDAAQSIFMRHSGPYYAYVANNTIGICDIDSDFNAPHASELMAADCIVVMGTPSPEIEKSLNEINERTAVVISRTVSSTKDYTPVAGVNLAGINAIAQENEIPRTEAWMSHIRRMRPSTF